MAGDGTVALAAAPPAGFADLPVRVDLPGVLGQEVVAWVEVEAGWQVVAEAGPPSPALALAAAPVPGTATVIVVDGPPTAAQVRDGLLAGALDVVGWPDDRDRLLDAPVRASSGSRPRGGPSVVGVAGAAGGAGTSTVALGVAGLLAWAGRRTVVVGGDDLVTLCTPSGWSGPGAPELAALDPAGAAAELATLVRPVPGVDGLAVLGGGAAAARPAGWPVDAVVLDLRTAGVGRGGDGPGGAGRGGDRPGGAPGGAQRGVRHRPGAPDLVVARPDASLRTAAGVPQDVPVMVVGDGPLDAAGARRLLGRAPVAWLPRSARVARAGLASRIPSGLPGSYVAALRAALARVRR